MKIGKTDVNTITTKNEFNVTNNNRTTTSKSVELNSYNFIYKPKEQMDMNNLTPINQLKHQIADYPSFFDCEPLFDDITEFKKRTYINPEYPDFLVSDCDGGICINKYLGDKQKIVVPEKVGGKKVVRIGGYFIASEEIKDGYDYYTDLSYLSSFSEITIPKYVKYIEGSEVCVPVIYSAKKITIASENPYYLSKNGEVYTKDKKCLLKTKTKAKIVINDGVENIHPYAFFNCKEKVKSVFLPNSVISFDVLNLNVDFTVGKNNKYYSSINGSLYNKDKTELICVGINETKNYIMPDSVKVIINDCLFENCTKITFGKGLESISESILNYGFIDSKVKKITVDENNKTFCMKDNALFSKDMTSLYFILKQNVSEYKNKDGKKFLIDYSVPEDVRIVYLFSKNNNLRIFIGENVKKVIAIKSDLGEYGDYILYGFNNSYIKKSAEKCALDFIDVETGKEYNY